MLAAASVAVEALRASALEHVVDLAVIGVKSAGLAPPVGEGVAWGTFQAQVLAAAEATGAPLEIAATCLALASSCIEVLDAENARCRRGWISLEAVWYVAVLEPAPAAVRRLVCLALHVRRTSIAEVLTGCQGWRKSPPCLRRPLGVILAYVASCVQLLAIHARPERARGATMRCLAVIAEWEGRRLGARRGIRDNVLGVGLCRRVLPAATAMAVGAAVLQRAVSARRSTVLAAHSARVGDVVVGKVLTLGHAHAQSVLGGGRCPVLLLGRPVIELEVVHPVVAGLALDDALLRVREEAPALYSLAGSTPEDKGRALHAVVLQEDVVVPAIIRCESLGLYNMIGEQGGREEDQQAQDAQTMALISSLSPGFTARPKPARSSLCLVMRLGVFKFSHF